MQALCPTTKVSFELICFESMYYDCAHNAQILSSKMLKGLVLFRVQVFPCPGERPHGRRLKRHRAPQLLEEEEEEDPRLPRDEEEREQKKKMEWKEREESQPCSEEGAENGQQETYVVLSSPETQEEFGVCIHYY